jgi:hypothetical protein
MIKTVNGLNSCFPLPKSGIHGNLIEYNVISKIIKLWLIANNIIITLL